MSTHLITTVKTLKITVKRNSYIFNLNSLFLYAFRYFSLKLRKKLYSYPYSFSIKIVFRLFLDGSDAGFTTLPFTYSA